MIPKEEIGNSGIPKHVIPKFCWDCNMIIIFLNWPQLGGSEAFESRLSKDLTVYFDQFGHSSTPLALS
jgi:hypothetical protein